MAAPKGNQFWKLACKKPGAKLVFATPKILLDAAYEYFASVDENPLYEDKVGFFQGDATHVDVAKKRPYTLSGLRLFLKIYEKTWADYRKRKDYVGVCKIVEEIIRNQKFEGAAAGLFNQCIIARDLGLTEKTEVHNTHVVADMTDPVAEMKKRGIPIPEIDLEDING